MCSDKHTYTTKNLLPQSLSVPLLTLIAGRLQCMLTPEVNHGLETTPLHKQHRLEWDGHSLFHGGEEGEGKDVGQVGSCYPGSSDPERGAESPGTLTNGFLKEVLVTFQAIYCFSPSLLWKDRQ